MPRFISFSLSSPARVPRRIATQRATTKATAMSRPKVGSVNLPMLISLGNMFLVVSVPAPPHIDQEESGADGDCAIGNVKGGELIGAEVEFQEIGYTSADDTVPDIAHGASQYQGQSGAKSLRRRQAAAPRLHQQGADEQHHAEGQSYQQEGAPLAARFGE